MAERITFVFVHRADGPVPAGRLRVVEDGRNAYAAFAYGARYVRRPDAIPVDPEALPLPDASEVGVEILTDAGFDLFNGIRDAAPDGWGRYLMQKASGPRTLGEFDYLVASGDQRVGALAFGSTSTRPERLAPWGSGIVEGEQLNLAELMVAARTVSTIDRLDPRLRRLLEAASSLGGARPKAATIHRGTDWIAKFSAADDSFDVPAAEYAAMRLARACGLDVPEVDAMRVFDKTVYLIERFDRSRRDEQVRRTPFVSGLTLLRAHEIAAGDYSYEELAGQLRKHGSAPARDMRELFRRMVFNVLIGNTDDHLRNHGFLHDGREWRLSPLYDVVPKPQVGTERRLVLALSREGKAATLRNALSGCAPFDLSPEEATMLIEEMRALVSTSWETFLREAGVSAEERERLAGCFSQALTIDWRATPEGSAWLP